MSPVAINFFRSIPTSLELDGPTISFIQHPSDGSENFAGLVTFTGICTARFPALSTESANGTFTFKWYLGDTQVEDTADDADSNARIVSVGIDTNVSIGGTTYERIGISTLTLTALDYTNNGKFKMKNIKRSTGYLIVILFWLILTTLLSSCGTWKWVEPMPPNAANNHRFNSICK